MEEQKTVWPYIKGYKFNSLLFRNFAYVFILVTLPLLLVLSLNYKKFNTVVNNQVMSMNEELLQKCAVVTDNVMVSVLDVVNRVSHLGVVTDVVQTEKINASYYDKVSKTISVVRERLMANNFIASVYIYSDVNEMLVNGSQATHISQAVDKGKWYDIHKQIPMDVPYILVNHANSIYVCQPIRSVEGERVGLFVADVELRKIRDILENQEIAQQGIFFVMDISGQIMYCNKQDSFTWNEELGDEYEEDVARAEAGQTLLVTDHDKRIVSVMESVHKSWKYAFVTQMPDYKEETEVISDFLISSAITGVIASVIAAYIITYLTYRPMKKIMNVIKNPQLHWSEREASKESNELLYITSNILANRNSKDEIAEELEERIRSLRQAQFRALQFQIDPHFLYNTLETIKWAAVEDMGLGNRTSKMLTKVAKLYRLGLENDDVIIPLKEEMDFLKLYIEIVRIRFGESIKFHWEIDESLYDCNVIKMCLQPIVENAIQHGLRPKNYLGNITISAYYEKECLCISVANDGQVIRQKEIKALNENLKTGAGFEESKVGLRNVNERIKLIYGKKYGVSVSNANLGEQLPSKGNVDVHVVLTFPCRNFNRSEEKK